MAVIAIIDFIRNRETRTVLANYLSTKGAPAEQITKLSSSIPRKLFKYCPLNPYSLSNLVNGELTISSPEVFNDIYDCTIHRNSFPSVQKRLDKLNSRSVAFGYKPIEMDMRYLKNDFAKRDRFYMTYMTEPMRVGCFSEDEKSILMWSHYADMNRGICIEYNFLNSPKHLSMIYPVIYLDKPLDMSDTAEKSEIGDLEKSVLLSSIVKSNVWEYEKEWRYIFYMITPEPQPDRVPIVNVPTPTKIYLGSKFLKYWISNGADSVFHDFCNYIELRNIPVEVIYNKILSFELSSKPIDAALLKELDERQLYKEYFI